VRRNKNENGISIQQRVEKENSLLISQCQYFCPVAGHEKLIICNLLLITTLEVVNDEGYIEADMR
jgi:hypothetical protein